MNKKKHSKEEPFAYALKYNRNNPEQFKEIILKILNNLKTMIEKKLLDNKNH